MIKTLFTGNFKAFAETQRIPICPITLIFGPNSAGKSSFIHSLALAREAERTGRLDIFKTEIGGSAIDLGGFRQYIHRGEAKRRMEWGAELDVSALQGRLAELLAAVKTLKVMLSIGVELDNEERPMPDSEPAVTAYELLADGELLLRMSRRRDNKLRLDRLNHEHPVFREVIKAIVITATTTDTVTAEDFEGIGDVINNLVPDLSTRVTRLFPEGLSLRSLDAGETEQPTLFPVSKGNRKEDLANAIKFFLPRTLDDLIRGSSQVVAQELKKLQYLGPLRSFPPRHLAFSEHEDANWYAGGGYAWDVVRRDAEVRNLVNEWLSAPDRLQTPYQLYIRKLVHAENTEEPLFRRLNELFHEAGFVIGDNTHEQVERLLSAMQNGGYLGVVPEIEPDRIVQKWAKGLADDMETISELCLMDLRSNTQVSHRDVGIGISQALPVLVGAYAHRGQIIAIEQPEIHLHPALQTELADVFIESALGERRNRYILETHSEHLILRLLRRIREGKLQPSDICVLYVEPVKGGGSRVVELGVDEDGDFIDEWPGGFFEESYHEKFAGR